MASISAVVNPTAVPPRVDLAVTLNQTPNPDGTTPTFTISRRDDDRARFVRGLVDQATTNGVAADYECPFGVPVVYQLEEGDKVTAVSQPVILTPVNLVADQVAGTVEGYAVWLRHPAIPRRSMPVDLALIEAPSYSQTRTVQTVMDRREPIVLSDTKRKNATTTLDIRTWTLAERDRLLTLLSDNAILLLSVPAQSGWGFTHQYIAVGDVSEERLYTDWAPFTGRVFHLPVEFVSNPVGGKVDVGCTYRAIQEPPRVCYVDFDSTYVNYAAMRTCNVSALPPDPTQSLEWKSIFYYPESNNQGQYGTSTTTTTPGGWNVINMNNVSGTYTNTPLPFMAVASPSFTMTAGAKYKIVGSAGYYRADTAGTFRFEYRVTPGTNATVSSGSVVGYGSTKVCGPGDLIRKDTDAANDADNAQGYFMFTGAVNGPAVISYNFTGSVTSVSTATDFNSTSGNQINIFERKDTVTTVTTGAKVITIYASLTLEAGHEYRIETFQYIRANMYPVQAYMMLYSGNATPNTSVPIGDTPNTNDAQLVQSGGGMGAIDLLAYPEGFPVNVTVESTGTYTIALRLESQNDDLFYDQTDGENPRFIQVWEYK